MRSFEERGKGGLRAALPNRLRASARCPGSIGIDTKRYLIASAVVTLALLVPGCAGEIVPDQVLEQALQEQATGNTDAATELYLQVLEVRPGDKFAHYNLGVIEQTAGRTDLAEGHYRAALATDPAFVPALFNLGTTREAIDTDEAISLFRRVIGLDDTHAKAHFRLGVLLLETGQDEEGVDELQRAVELDPFAGQPTASSPPRG